MLSRLIQKYYALNHLHRIDGTDQEDGIAVAPYILVDISYQYFSRDILPLALSHEAKLVRTRWAQSNKAFISELSSCFSPDEYEEFLDLMDNLGGIVNNDLLVLQVQGMNCVSDHFSFEHQKIISSALVSNYVALLAQNIWNLTHTSARGTKHIDNRNLNGILQWSREFSRAYMNQLDRADFIVPDDKVEALDKAVAAFKRKVIAWIKSNLL